MSHTIKRKKGQPVTIYFGDSNHSGVDVTYVKGRKMLYFSGWYDGWVGISGGSMTLDEFLEILGEKK